LEHGVLTQMYKTDRQTQTDRTAIANIALCNGIARQL